ncbi:glycosyltransferase family 4 protein [Planococcus liqunii]|uniref:Glycosyltransferase family 4 protein n=1 Tax=Planococcus liqunii TaxID=3058394 RepID=A0ABT8MTU4_9BACL|nr:MULTISPECIES: glycosyltransferase family 4 protein [unclassified Planococcus (in: firmicutes)]MDN7228332.1 glycosyltransferase family 4 protein [Planococcus sp. N064]WKA50841.1 glycosyltransferase family 4 protein [Planococcus sp. N056]
MKIVLAAPNYPQPRGNTVTVRRMAANLEQLGIETQIVSTTGENRAASLPSADLIHGFHAYYFHQFLQGLDDLTVPYIITMTGTDLNVDLFDSQKRDGVLSALAGAKAIHVFDQSAQDLLLKEAPEFQGKVFPIAQGASSFPKDSPLFQKEDGTFLFVLPAGIRQVKNIPFAIQSLEKLQQTYPHLRLWLVGPVLEETEAEIVFALAEKHAGWIRYLGELPHEQMGAVYRQADAVLNTSLSEGQPAAILEAMGSGLPVLVSDVQGNNGMVEHGRTGYLYNGQTEFLEYAEQLMNNKEVRKRIGQQAKHYAAVRHSALHEAEALLKIYRRIVE